MSNYISSLLVLQFDTARLAHSETQTLQSACFHDCNVCYINRAREPGNGGISQLTNLEFTNLIPRSFVSCSMTNTAEAWERDLGIHNIEKHKVLSS